MAAMCLLYGGLEIDFFNSFSTFRRCIDKAVIPITTKIWQKTARKFFVSKQNCGTLSTNVCLSINEFWNLSRNFFHTKPWKTNLYQRNMQVER